MYYRRLKNITHIVIIGAVLLSGISLSGCSSDQPDTVYYGEDACAHCTMLISDKRFAAQLKTSKGKAFKFDAIECMAAYQNERSAQLSGANLWVTNFTAPDKWISVEKAIFLQSSKIKSPMGLSLLAVKTQEQLNKVHQQFDGESMRWTEIRELVQQSWNN